MYYYYYFLFESKMAESHGESVGVKPCKQSLRFARYVFVKLVERRCENGRGCSI